MRDGAYTHNNGEDFLTTIRFKSIDDVAEDKCAAVEPVMQVPLLDLLCVKR